MNKGHGREYNFFLPFKKILLKYKICAKIFAKKSIRELHFLCRVGRINLAENLNFLIYQYRAEFPVHFPESILEKFRSDKGKYIGNCAPCNTRYRKYEEICPKEGIS